MAIVPSIIVHLHHGCRPHTRLLVARPSCGVKTVPLEKGSAPASGLAIYLRGA